MALIHTPKLRKEPNCDPSACRKSIEDCKVLLTSLPEGIYSMDWYGVLPKFKIHDDDIYAKGVMTITVQTKIKFSKMLRLKIPYTMKKIEICDNDLNCIEL